MKVTHNVARQCHHSGTSVSDPISLPALVGIELTSARPETDPRLSTPRPLVPKPVVGIAAIEADQRAVDRVAREIVRARMGGIPSVTEVIGE